jgi:hypothetical protein
VVGELNSELCGTSSASRADSQVEHWQQDEWGVISGAARRAEHCQWSSEPS